jgi:15-cis-phytoene synthase
MNQLLTPQIELNAPPMAAAVLTQQVTQVMRRHAKSFNWAARFLSPATRADTQLLYAFARLADDLADEPELGALPHRLALLAGLKAALKADSQPSQHHNELADAVSQLRLRHGLATELFNHFLDSLMADVHPRQLTTQPALLEFAYGVAGTVGLMMRPVLGAGPAADGHALALGMAMQLTNIARDVVEDAARGRVYLPGSLALTHTANPAITYETVVQVLALADEFYAFAQQGLWQIPPQNQRAIHIALALYRGIGQKILRRGHQRYWQGRTHLSWAEKVRLTLPLLWCKFPTHPPAHQVDYPRVVQALTLWRELPGVVI